MAGPKLLPEIGTGLGNRKKAEPDLGFRDEKVVPTETSKKIDMPKETVANKATEKYSDVLKLRKGVINDLQSGQVDQDEIMARIQNSGISNPDAIEAILSPQLNDNVIKYFLGVTKNNPKQAKVLAKKFGFEV